MRVFQNCTQKGGKPNVCSEHVDFEKCSGVFLSVYVRKRWVNAVERLTSILQTGVTIYSIGLTCLYK